MGDISCRLLRGLRFAVGNSNRGPAGEAQAFPRRTCLQHQGCLLPRGGMKRAPQCWRQPGQMEADRTGLPSSHFQPVTPAANL
jgi:hypothetical protein